jgi:hypothetical protein
MLDVPHEEGLDVERFTAELPGLADGRRTLFAELARLATPEVELSVSEFADRSRRNLGRLSLALGAPLACPICGSRWTAFTRTTHRAG